MHQMKKTTKSFMAIIGISMVAILISATPAKTTFTVSKNYTVSIHGTSNLHDWDEKVGTVTGEGNVKWNADGSFDLTAINIKMDVHSIKSDMGSVMDNNTYKALKASSNPEIIFKLESPVNNIPKASEKIVSALGNLSIAGVTRAVNMQVKVYMQPSGTLTFEGSQTVKTTDYGVDPPTALFGTLKTGKEIKINFKINLQ